ncbi:ADP-heptose synthase [Paenibacillus silviterrae]|uniref:ADP-heptose synthase n=1 Tax=Paenibacillus silviterrae TaxID=3242194 RepID=UPI002543A893|nr:ADP-heptose synthase [Paenibacillus chinjuensis]
MSKRFVIEAVLTAIYGELMLPSQPVDYIIPYSTIRELYELKDSPEPIMPDPADEAHVRVKIQELIAFFEDPFNRKKIERALAVPWRISPPMPINDRVTFTVMNSFEDAQFGEGFDPIETEIILCAMKEKAPILTDQVEFLEKAIESEIAAQIYDIDDFEFAVEEGISFEEWKSL